MKKEIGKAVALAALFSLALLALAACGEKGEEAAATPAPGALAAAHLPLEKKTAKPKRLEAVVEIDMHEMYFGNPKGEKNPSFRLPAGKTVGIHIHNEGSVTHELAIGRNAKKASEGFEYGEALKVPTDLFFYYGDQKVEVEGAEFGEVEVDPGMRDMWIRGTFPKGEWELGCFVEGHYEAGMKAKLIFE
ncbi:MAG TPA: sulfocyanin-like copper-binding protein [Dehalococcoidia bacterium]|nr:sulfocyanin-like copper-binding protein [Dehalococcoidia bacterium]HLB29452.1 sulfocyanin-like copper-binding protein [Dehalococcoidia bacterium]